MDIMDAIRNRRSIRKYTAQPVEREKLDALIGAGFLAPSGSNAQNWFITVITNEALLEKLGREGKDAVIRAASPMYQKMASAEGYKLIHGAPCFIIVSYDPLKPNGPIDAALAIQNICLAALSMGLGTCINGLVNYLLNPEGMEGLREEFGIPAGMLCAAGISVGYPDQSPQARPRDNTKAKYID